jgi:prepilin signal peptidase PulO-like enzyme (type II secretory pathway)
MPVISWLVQFGKTKCCGEKLSWKYLFGEVILGLWFVGCYLWFGWNVYLLSNIFLILSLVLGSIFFVLVMEDLDDMSVSSRYLYLLCALAVLGPLIKGAGENTPGDFIPILIFSPFWLIYFAGKYLEKPMIGEADPYVFTVLGIFFGTQFSISLFLYSVWSGILVKR